MRPKAWIYGSVPEPVGGVSVTIERLIDFYHDNLGGLVDPYFAKNKRALPIEHVHPDSSSAYSALKVLTHLFAIRNVPLFINGSTPRSILALSPFLFGRSAKTALMLHHGDLQKYVTNRPWFAKVVGHALKSYDQIGCLSPSQQEFFLSVGVSEKRLYLVETYLGPPKASENAVSPIAQEVIDWIRSRPGLVVVGSGYNQPNYRHEWGVEYLDSLGNQETARYLLCSYGPKTEYYEALVDRFAGRTNAKLVYGLTPYEFDIVLRQCDIYVRPVDSESYGIAIRDAVRYGLTAVASDSCERPPGALLHTACDYSSFARQLNTAIQQRTLGLSSAGVESGRHSLARIPIADFMDSLRSVDK